jgi:transcriptional regulator NrdR family protein
MKINLRIEFLDGRSIDPVVVQMPEMLKFEEKFSVSVSVLEKEQKLTYIAFLAWASLFRQKVTDKTFDEFVETIASVSASEADPK